MKTIVVDLRPARLFALALFGILVNLASPDTVRAQCEFTEQTKLPILGDGSFGFSVAIDGDTALVWANVAVEGGHSSSAFVFVHNPDGAGSWEQQAELLAGDGPYWTNPGSAVAISGDVAVIGATWNNTVSVFERASDGSGSWTKQAELTPDGGAWDDHFGETVSIDGDIILIGAHYDDSNGNLSGSAFVFVRDPNEPESWIQQDKLFPEGDAAELKQFGRSVALSGETALIGAFWDNENGGQSGAAYVFVPDPNGSGHWIQQAKLLADDGVANDLFGESVAIDGNIAVITAPTWGSYAAYVFKYNGSNWVQRAKLTPEGGPAYGPPDHSIAIKGDTILIGACDYAGTSGPHSGAAYVFGFDGTTWVEKARLLASEGAQNADFGASVALFGDTAVIGATSGAGAAYVFNIGDCNGNVVLDACDISAGSSSDNDDNGIPDECDCLGDTNGDRMIDPLDSGFVLARFGCSYPLDGINCLIADFNDDGVVDPLDVGLVLSRFGSCD